MANQLANKKQTRIPTRISLDDYERMEIEQSFREYIDSVVISPANAAFLDCLYWDIRKKLVEYYNTKDMGDK